MSKEPIEHLKKKMLKNWLTDMANNLISKDNQSENMNIETSSNIESGLQIKMNKDEKYRGGYGHQQGGHGREEDF